MKKLDSKPYVPESFGPRNIPHVERTTIRVDEQGNELSRSWTATPVSTSGEEPFWPGFLFLGAVIFTTIWLLGTIFWWLANQGEFSDHLTLFETLKAQWQFITGLKVW